MCRKLICLFTFIVVLSIAGNASAELVAHWRFDEGSGRTAFDLAGGHDGTLEGDPQWVAGQVGSGALEFDGAGDFVNCGSSPDYEIPVNITVACWIKVDVFDKTWQAIITTSDSSWRVHRSGDTNNIAWGTTGVEPLDLTGTTDVSTGDWFHVAAVYNGSQKLLYINGELDASSNSTGNITASTVPVYIGDNSGATGRFWAGLIDDVRIYNNVLTQTEIQSAMLGEGFPYASGPVPADGSLYADTWASMSWRAGDFAVSHDVYFGVNYDDVDNGTSDTFQGNQDLNNSYLVVGFPGFPYPEGLVPGTTYYWRVDEVNEADPNSPWKGPVWSFAVPPKTAYTPVPADNAEFVDLNVKLSWTPGFGAKLNYVVFGQDFGEVSNAAMGVPSGPASYSPGQLELAKTYYWRVDEFDGVGTYKGEVWSFTTEGAVTGPNPADGAVDVKPSMVLGWVAGAVAESHEVYFGTDADAVKNATTSSPEYKGPKALGEESYEPGKLTFNTTYYWRIDEVNSVNADSPWPGNVWSFTTGDFFVIDDFEGYDAGDNQIWYAWHDGLGYGAPGTADYFAGNGTGAAVGDETTASYTEETIVHGGSQSMPISCDNNKQGYSKYSEVELALADQRDWTEQGVAELSLWFRGYPASTGSFVEGPVGTFTMTASGSDIWAVNSVEADEFHFAYKMLTGAGTMVAKVVSVENTNVWAKAGVMIRETLNPDSAHAMMVVTPGSGASFQRRPGTGQTSLNTDSAGIVAPYWVKIERDMAGNFTGYISANGSTWELLGTEPIPMSANAYVGLAVTSHDAALTCQAVFTNVTTTGNVSGQWTNQDIGILSNDAEPLYVALSNSTGTPAVVVHDDPAAAQINTWTEWVIPLQAFADQGIVLTNVDRIAIGMGTKGNMTIPGGAGKIFIDDVRLLKPAPEPEPEPLP